MKRTGFMPGIGWAAIVLLVLAGCQSGSTPPAASNVGATPVDLAALEARWLEHVQYLADPALGGRGIGTPGHAAAADYIARHFFEAGLKVQRQRVPMLVGAADAGLRLNVGPESHPRGDWLDVYGEPMGGSGKFSGPAVVLGPVPESRERLGELMAELQAGDVVVFFRPQGDALAVGRRMDELLDTAAGAGVSAVVLVEPPESFEYPLPGPDWRDEMWAWQRPLHPRRMIGFSTGDGEIGGLRSPFDRQANQRVDPADRPVLLVAGWRAMWSMMWPTRRGLEPSADEWTGHAVRGTMQADRLVSPRGESIILSGAYKPPAAGLPENIFGVRQGSGRLGWDAVWVLAHYDHLRSDEGLVYPGADDNASGVAALLELAGAMSAAVPESADAERGQSAVVLVATTAEEHGMLGARWIHHSPPRLTGHHLSFDALAGINLDMIGSLDTSSGLQVLGVQTFEAWPMLLRRAAAGLSLNLDLRRPLPPWSDHVLFARSERRAVHLFTGHHNRWHRPSDTVETLNTNGGTRITAMLIRLVERLRVADVWEVDPGDPAYEHVKDFLLPPGSRGSDLLFGGSDTNDFGLHRSGRDDIEFIEAPQD